MLQDYIDAKKIYRMKPQLGTHVWQIKYEYHNILYCALEHCIQVSAPFIWISFLVPFTMVQVLSVVRPATHFYDSFLDFSLGAMFR